MKRALITSWLLLLILMLSLGASQALAQPAPPPSHAESKVRYNTIHLDPLSMVFGYFGLAYERVIARHVSLQIGGFFLKSWLLDEVAKGSIWGTGGELRPFFYLLKPAPSGLYLSPFFRAVYVHGESGAVKADAFGWGIGSTIGWAWIWDRVTLRVGVGAGYIDTQAEGSDGSTATKIGSKGWRMAGDLSFGIRF